MVVTLNIILSIITFVFVLNVVLAAAVVFFERRSPSSTWAWILFYFLYPL